MYLTHVHIPIHEPHFQGMPVLNCLLQTHVTNVSNREARAVTHHFCYLSRKVHVLLRAKGHFGTCKAARAYAHAFCSNHKHI